MTNKIPGEFEKFENEKNCPEIMLSYFSSLQKQVMTTFDCTLVLNH